MSAKYIVTGGAGFIGSNIVAALNARGETDILVVDHLGRDEKWKNLIGLQFDDVLEPDVFRQMIRENRLGPAGTLFHMGACSATTETDASYLLDNNYRFTRELCQWALGHRTRFIYASSGATYGSGARGYSDDDLVTPSLQPLNMYGYSKHLFDLLALRHGWLKQVAGLKFFNVYGPREDHKGDMRSVLHKAHCQIRASGSVQLFKSYRPDYRDGEQLRDFVYVRDAVEVCLWLAAHPDIGGLFNVGTGRARTWVDLAQAMFAAMARPPRIEFIDMPETLRPKYQYHTCADIAKLRRAGYAAPFTSLEQGAHDYVKSWLAVHTA